MISIGSSHVAEAPAVDASPLIFLGKTGHLDLLRLTAEEIVVPEPVASEIQRRGPQDITARALAQTPWLRVVPSPPIPTAIQSWDLGPGESAVLAWCLDSGSEAILDDLAARRCAAIFDIPLRGTLGLVLIAKQRGHIPRARPVLMTLRRAGMYLSDKVLDQALRRVGE